eukprot:4130860-Prymnesium_polylepis.1
MSHSPGLHPKAAKAASYHRYTAPPSAKHEWKRCRRAPPLICESLVLRSITATSSGAAGPAWQREQRRP